MDGPSGGKLDLTRLLLAAHICSGSNVMFCIKGIQLFLEILLFKVISCWIICWNSITRFSFILSMFWLEDLLD